MNSFTPFRLPLATSPAWVRHAWRITLIYAGFASLWILLSDRLMFHFFSDYQNIVWLNVAKGGFFIFVTSALLWSLMRRMLLGLERSQRELAEREEQVRTVCNAVNDGILVVRPATGEILCANLTAEVMFRCSDQDLQSLGLADLGLGEIVAITPLSAAEANEGLAYPCLQCVVSCRRRDESVFWAEVVCRRARLMGEDCLLVTIRDITERHQAEQEVRESRRRLRALLTHHEEAREEERARISREVHDVLGQLLTGVKMNLKWIMRRLADPEAANGKLREKLEETESFANATLSSIQEIAHDLRPNILDRLGLMPALRFEAGRFTKRSGIDCQFNSLCDAIALPPEQQTHVFRIVQELLTNVERHARAQMVVVNVLRNPHGVSITVSDDGVGISNDAARAPGSLGIIGMMERAVLLGGALEVKRAPNRGTTAVLTFKENPS